MKNKSHISYKRERVAVWAVSIICLCIICNMVPVYSSERINHPGGRITDTSLQTMTLMDKYYAPCQIVYDASMYQDEVQVEQEGSPGIRKTTQLISYVNGYEAKETTMNQEVVVPAVARTVRVGIKERPKYCMPLESYVLTSDFGPRWGRMHEGVDLAVETGTSVYASANGTVIWSGYNGGYGICVDIEHDDHVVTRYAHLSESLVEVGQSVKQADVIAKSGNTGHSTGPHLHFEIRIDDTVVDPLTYVEELHNGS